MPRVSTSFTFHLTFSAKTPLERFQGVNSTPFFVDFPPLNDSLSYHDIYPVLYQIGFIETTRICADWFVPVPLCLLSTFHADRPASSSCRFPGVEALTHARLAVTLRVGTCPLLTAFNLALAKKT
ncbi:hypothetical protein VTN00DRAFT_698 [Thermoascus crustaceus]|uniref:uncharacterized protein n=1 Tax=Thermoascus crustaceus TaxID=5088 RepID=UPI003742FD5B